MSGSERLRLQSQLQSISIGVRGTSAQIPISYALEQNYPNPFNPTTEIRYALPADSRVSIKVFNVAGQEVANLVEGIQSAGYHSTPWDSHTLGNVQAGSGVYFYRLIATNLDKPGAAFEQVRKMVLLK